MTHLERQLNDILSAKDLLQHPFYQAWSNGTLPTDKLRVYAREYGSFIELIEAGWHACHEREIAAVEAEHYELWKGFSGSLGNETIEATINEVKGLTGTCEKHFSDYASSLGALYAFEAQQPATATSKLKGLRDHYVGLQADETYFKVHVDDEEEPALILQKMEALPQEDQDRAVAACREVADQLWNALSGIMDAEMAVA
jgi:pyrroloquinoline-quinone synthase